MQDIITSHTKRESSLLDVETQFKTKAIRAVEALQPTVTDQMQTQAAPEEVYLLVGWEVFRNELEFE